jgi:hypothetical protein
MKGLISGGFDGTGRTGRTINIGKGNKRGASRAIDLDRSNRDRNSDDRENGNIGKGLRFSDIISRDSSSKDDPRFNSQNDLNLKKDLKE